MPPQNNLAPVGLTKAEFNKHYWFTSLQMVTVVNPTENDFPFMVEMRHYMVKAGAQESFVGPIANVYLNHMAKTMAQNDERLEMMSDPTFVAATYKSLIVEVKNLAPEYDPTNNWQHRMNREGADLPPWAQPQAQAQAAPQVDAAPTPPWEQAQAAAQPPAPPKEPPKPKLTEDETKQFKLNGIVFKAVTKNGQTDYFKNGKEISVADYSKAASLV
jgi:hypothetical protein